MLRLAAHRHALRSLAVIAFAESSFFPIPADVMVIPMVLARRDQAWRIAAVAAGSSILGGMLGYAIGYFLWDSVGRPVADFYHITAQVEDYRQRFHGFAAPIILLQGLTPLPFKLVAIASGLADAGLGVRAAAGALNLDFISLASEQYDLLIARAFFESARGEQLLEVIGSEGFKRAVTALGGYDTTRAGALLYRQ